MSTSNTPKDPISASNAASNSSSESGDADAHSSNLWLVRTAENWIEGPHPASKVCQMILAGQLKAEDEVCLASGFWIFLSEREEIQRHLGVQVPEQITSISVGGESSENNDPTIETAVLQERMGTSLSHVHPNVSIGSNRIEEKSGIGVGSNSASFGRGFAWFLVAVGLLLIAGVMRFLF